MKPKYIFSSVFAVVMMMALGLPRLVISQPVQAAQTANQTVQYIETQPAPTTAPTEPLAQTVELAPPLPTPAAESAPAAALGDSSIPLTSVAAPELQSFIASLINNRPSEAVGVYAAGLFALPIIQQPTNDHNFISPFDGILTQYAPPSEHGTTGLLAHNYLSGRIFFNLRKGQEVFLIYGDGRLKKFEVTAIEQFQALSPLDPYSNFIDLADPNSVVQSFSAVYERFYTQSDQIVFQTCIERNGDLSWGRLFVVAKPEP